MKDRRFANLLASLLLLLVVSSIVMSAISYPAYGQTAQATLSISTKYADGAPLAGMWVVLRQNAQAVATGYTPINFKVIAGQQYTVTVSNYRDMVFHHWQDGPATASRSISITRNAGFVALYTSTSHPLPAPPKTFASKPTDNFRTVDVIKASAIASPKSYARNIAELASFGDDLSANFTPAPHQVFMAQVGEIIVIDDMSDVQAPKSFASSIDETLAVADILSASVVAAPQSFAKELAGIIIVTDDVGANVTLASPPSQSYARSIGDMVAPDDSIGALAKTPPFTPIVHMNDTTASYGVLVSATPQQISAEWAKQGSQLIGDNIDSITLRLQRVGAPTGSAEIAVFDANANVKKLFAAVDVALLPAAMTDMEFRLPVTDPLYTIQLDDRIGIRYTGGSSSSGVSVMMDKVTTDSVFDGQNSQRVRYTTAWVTYDINEDLYMILRQTKAGAGSPPSPPSQVSLDVNAATQDGAPVSGVYTVIHKNGAVQGAKNTPLHYIATAGQTYTVTPSAYEIFQTGSYTFDHWQNDGSIARARTVTPANATTLTAVYRHNPAGIVSIMVRSAAMADNSTISGILFDIAQTPRPNIAPSYSPVSWTLEGNTKYVITPQDYGSYVFDHWQDGNSTRARTVYPSTGLNLTSYFRLQLPVGDTSPPTIAVRAPAPPRTVTTLAATISGTASDDTGVQNVSISIDGGEFKKADGLVKWSMLIPALSSGNHTATVRVLDATGNSANSTINFNVTPHPLLNKTGVYIPLYFYPSGANLAQYDRIASAKIAHLSVPIIAAINPGGGPGSAPDPNFTSAINNLNSAGVTVIGYTPTLYGSRNSTAIKADIQKYVTWYPGISGIMLDEFANNAGYEAKYADLTAYAKSLGLKLVIGNAGTDPPQTYVGTVDVIGITEGDGYPPVPWLQHCVGCSVTSDGWHYNYEKNNFRFSRYAIDTLDPNFVKEASKWVGLLYLTNGVSPARWSSLPPYFDDLVRMLDAA